jgi:hypothetical protein
MTSAGERGFSPAEPGGRAHYDFTFDLASFSMAWETCFHT